MICALAAKKRVPRTACERIPSLACLLAGFPGAPAFLSRIGRPSSTTRVLCCARAKVPPALTRARQVVATRRIAAGEEVRACIRTRDGKNSTEPRGYHAVPCLLSGMMYKE